MNTKSLGFLVTAFLFTISLNAFAADYNFKGRAYKLSPFIDQEPKQLIESIEKSNVPPEMNIRDLQTPPRDQSNRGSCAHFAATALLEAMVKNKTNEEVNISEEYLIYYTKEVRHSFSNTEGSTSYQNLLAYKRGFLLEKDAPYQPSWFAKNLPCQKYDSSSSSAPIYCFAHYSPSEEILKGKIKDYDLDISEFYESGGNFSTQIMDYISQENLPVIIALPINQKGWDGNTGHSIYDEKLRKECQEDKDLCGGHAVLVTGYNLEKKIFMFKNSWGGDWGDQGYGTLPFEYVDRYSQANPITGTIDFHSPINLPEGHNDPIKIELTNVNLNLDLEYIDEATNEKQIYVSLDSSFKDKKNNIVYISTFIGHQSNLEEPVGNENFTFLQAPENFWEKYGALIAGRFYFFLESETAIFNSENPSEMKIPYKLINPEDIVDKNIFLRVSLYGHSDSGWLPQYRKYVPVEI